MPGWSCRMSRHVSDATTSARRHSRDLYSRITMRRSRTSTNVRTFCRFLLLALLPLLFHLGCGQGAALPTNAPGAQPVQFNHKLHVADQGLDCVECHRFVMKNRKATLPEKEVCAGCH